MRSCVFNLVLILVVGEGDVKGEIPGGYFAGKPVILAIYSRKVGIEGVNINLFIIGLP